MPLSSVIPAASARPCGWRDADAHDYEVHVHGRTIRQFGRGHTTICAIQAGKAEAFVEFDAVRLVQVAEIVCRLGRGNAAQNAGGCFDQSDVHLALGANRCCLEPDVAATDD